MLGSLLKRIFLKVSFFSRRFPGMVTDGNYDGVASGRVNVASGRVNVRGEGWRQGCVAAIMTKCFSWSFILSCALLRIIHLVTICLETKRKRNISRCVSYEGLNTHLYFPLRAKQW